MWRQRVGRSRRYQVAERQKLVLSISPGNWIECLMAKYGAVKQHPYSFQDDVLIQVESVEDLRATNVKMTEVMNMMQTELNKTKSGYILMGTEEQLAEARQRMKEEPMMCNEFVMMATTLQED